MASYSLLFKPSVEKDLKHLGRQAMPRILETIEGLATNPFPAASKKLVGAENTYRLRIGDYRAIYTVDRGRKEIEIQRVRHRKDAYR